MPALAGLVVPFADLGQVAGQIVGAFGAQEAVGLHQAAGEIGAVAIDVQLGHGTCLVQPLPVAFGGHVRRGRGDAETVQGDHLRDPLGADAGVQAGQDAAHAVADRRTCPSGA